MNAEYVSKYLTDYNKWRRYNGEIGKGPQQPCAIELGLVIDAAIKLLSQEYSLDSYKPLDLGGSA